MNRIVFAVVFLAMLLFSIHVFAWQSAKTYLQQLPALPENICEASAEVIMEWNNSLLVLKNEMIELQEKEKEQMELAKANATIRMDMFEPANAEEIQQLGEKISVVENDINKVLTEITSSLIEKGGDVDVKYLAILDPLYQQKKDTQSQGKSTALIDKEIREAQRNKCMEMSAVRKNYLKNYSERLEGLIELGIKGNQLSDEMLRMMYADYTVRRQYGFWLDILIGYVGELLYVYNDIPVYETEQYNR